MTMGYRSSLLATFWSQHVTGVSSIDVQNLSMRLACAAMGPQQKHLLISVLFNYDMYCCYIQGHHIVVVYRIIVSEPLYRCWVVLSSL
jgi:hypothetical protein